MLSFKSTMQYTLYCNITSHGALAECLKNNGFKDYTVVYGQGCYNGNDEMTAIITIILPASIENNKRIKQLAESLRVMFKQESVLATAVVVSSNLITGPGKQERSAVDKVLKINQAIAKGIAKKSKPLNERQGFHL